MFAGGLATFGAVALVAFFGCTARTQLSSMDGAARASHAPPSVSSGYDSGPNAGAAGQADRGGGQAGSLSAWAGGTTGGSDRGTAGSVIAHASGGAGGGGVGGAHASGGTSGAGTACLMDADCPGCGWCGDETVCTRFQCRQGTCRLLCDECANDGDCVIAYDVSKCCPACPEAFPRALVAAEPCLMRPTEAVPFECQPLGCPDACEQPICVVDAQYARCVQGACLASRCPRGSVGEGCRPLTEADLDECRSPSDCIVVPYAHCCGATKRAINRLYLEEYNQHPEWQSYPGSCIMTGVCRDDSQVTSATCNTTLDEPSRCELVFP